MRHGTRILFAGVTVVAVMATGCSSGSGDTGSQAADEAHETFAFGEPANTADADRTVEISTLDSLSYDPSSLTVSQGEVVHFVVTNPGKIAHEFTLGDESSQEDHEEEMTQMRAKGQMMMGDEPNAIALEPGQTKELTWKFTQVGTVYYACHEIGHFAGGMKSPITVS